MRSGRAAAWLAAAMLGAVAAAGCDLDSVDCDKPFDRAAWNRADSIEPSVDGQSPRRILTDALIECDTLIGAPPTRTRRLLGTPGTRSRQDDGARTWHYLIGPDSIGIDSEYLIVVFRQSRVSELRRVQG